jgi:hypothetical protein
MAPDLDVHIEIGQTRKIFQLDRHLGRSREDYVKETAPILQFLSLVYHRSPALYGVEKQSEKLEVCAE